MSKSPIKPKDVKKFERLAQALADHFAHIQSYFPEAELYLAMEDLYLMKGPSHTGYNDKARQDNVVTSVCLGHKVGGGDW